jgi:hypothetical protein
LTAEIIPFMPRRRPGPRIQTERSKIEPPSAHAAFVSYYFKDAVQDERLNGSQRLLLLELSILAATASGRPLGYSVAELAMMFSWEPVKVRADAEVCARLGYLDISDAVLLLRDPKDRPRAGINLAEACGDGRGRRYARTGR